MTFKAHEESWDHAGDLLIKSEPAAPWPRNFSKNAAVIAVFDEPDEVVVGPETLEARCRLASAAPEMARVLLEIDRALFRPGGSRQVSETRILNALIKAGVLPCR